MRVAVIGAGISGIVSLKSCLEEDIDVVCYEGSSHVGGLWAVESESCIMYDSLLTNTSKEGMAFSDFPPPTEWPSYITAAQVNEYILAYCSHFNLLDKIRLEHKILDISKTEDHDVSGQWLVTVHHNKETVVQTFDAVMVCTGISRFPFTPDYPNMNRFKGDIIHSAFYKNHTKFSKSQRILVIGNSSSGLDIAADLCKRKSKAVGLFGKGLRMLTNTVKSAAEEEYGKSGELDQAMSGLEAHSNVLNNAVQRTSDSTSPPVYVSCRSAVLIFKRKYGAPADLTMSWFFIDLLNTIPRIMAKIINLIALPKFDYKKYNMKVPDIEQYFLESDKKIMAALNDEIFDYLEAGSVRAVPGVSEFNKDGVKLSDGQELKLDAVVIATGFQVKVPFMDKKLINPDHWFLYKHVWPVGLQNNTLAVLGHIRVAGPFPPIAELQARWAAQVFKGVVKLPNNEVMKLRTKGYVKTETSNMTGSLKVTPPDAIVLAREINCLPSLGQVLLQPLRWLKVYFGPTLPYMFRIVGRGKWPHASDMLSTAKSRIRPSDHEIEQQAIKSKKMKRIIYLGGVFLLAISIYLAKLGLIAYRFYELVKASVRLCGMIWDGLVQIKDLVFGS